MATYKAEHLKAMIRQVVREEIKGVVSEVISEVLSDRYLKHLAESAAAARPRGVSMNLPIQGDDENDEETPTVLSNDILGVGEDNPAYTKESKKDGVRQFESANPMLSLFFEGTKPIDVGEDEDDGFDKDLIEAARAEKATLPENKKRPVQEVWKELAGVKNVKKPSAPSPEEIEALQKREENRLKMMREQLDKRT